MIQLDSTPFLIGVAGPSGAGKSVFCKLVQSTFAGVSRLKLDDFFKDMADVPKLDEWVNWDQPSSIKWPELIKATRDLKTGSHAVVPNYSRELDCCVGEKCVFPSEIILIDGFMCLYNEELRDLLDLKLFFNLSEHSQIRRRKERQPWVEDGYLENVMLPAARTYILPSKQHADYVLNAELPRQSVADMGMHIVRSVLNSRVKKLKRRRQFTNVPVKANI